jgi:hypothetical protein
MLIAILIIKFISLFISIYFVDVLYRKSAKVDEWLVFSFFATLFIFLQWII